jgi:hypothetical protein
MKDYGTSIGARVILSLLSLILLLPCYWALGGIYYALTVESPTSHEGFIGAGLISIYAVFVWLPYLIYLYISRKDTSTKFKLVCSIPFLILVCCFLVAL